MSVNRCFHTSACLCATYYGLHQLHGQKHICTCHLEVIPALPTLANYACKLQILHPPTFLANTHWKKKGRLPGPGNEPTDELALSPGSLIFLAYNVNEKRGGAQHPISHDKIYVGMTSWRRGGHKLSILKWSNNFSLSNTALRGLQGPYMYYTCLKASEPYLPSMSNWSTWNHSSPLLHYHDLPPFLPLYIMGWCL